MKNLIAILLVFLAACGGGGGGGGGGEDVFSADRLSGTYRVQLFTTSDNCEIAPTDSSTTTHTVQRVSDTSVVYTFEGGQDLTGDITTSGFRALGFVPGDPPAGISCTWTYNGGDSYLISHAIATETAAGTCIIELNGTAEKV